MKKVVISLSKSDSLEIEGEIVQVQPSDFFQVKVKLGENDHLIRAKISGRLRKNKIKLILGDKVTITLSPYDLSTGLITWRH